MYSVIYVFNDLLKLAMECLQLVHVDSNVHHVSAKQENVALTSGSLTPGAMLTLAGSLQEKQLLSQSSIK